VLLTGSSGVGKTAVILDTLSRLADAQYGTVEVDDGKDGAMSMIASTGDNPWVNRICFFLWGLQSWHGTVGVDDVLSIIACTSISLWVKRMLFYCGGCRVGMVRRKWMMSCQ
jgi:hypothetical protein